MGYNNPEDFLKAAQVLLKNNPPIEDERHDEFTRITDEELKQFDEFKGITRQEISESNFVIKNLFKFIEDSMDKEELEHVRNNIAFGRIENSNCNAMCVKSHDGKYAVLIYDGLMNLLHKHGKLLFAAQDPDKVTFCNRGNPKKLNRKQYLQFAKELIENYKKYGTPVGAMIKLEYELMVPHSISLALQELFVLCHELGHFFNGDLEKKQNFYTLTQYNWDVFDDNKDHSMEFKADLTGFSIFEKAVVVRFPELPRKFLLAHLSILFDTLALLNAKGSKSHPAPIDRMMNIITHHYGVNVAREFLETYESKEKVQSFFNF